MARRPKWEDDDLPSVPRGFWVRARYHVLVVLSLVVILYGAAQIMARTAGFRDLVGQQLEARLGLPVKIEDSRVNARFDLTLENVVTEGTKRPDSPGLRAKRMYFAWSLADWLRGGLGVRAVDLEGCKVVLRRDDSGGWAPREFQPLSDVLGKWLEFDLAPATNATARADQEAATNGYPAKAKSDAWQDKIRAARVRFSLTRGEVIWWSGGSAELASVKGVDLHVTPVEVPGRSLTHLRLTVDQAISEKGERVSDVQVELLDAGDRQFVLGFEAARQRGPNP